MPSPRRSRRSSPRRRPTPSSPRTLPTRPRSGDWTRCGRPANQCCASRSDQAEQGRRERGVLCTRATEDADMRRSERLARVSMRVATAEDLEAIGKTLAGAFEHDPIWGWAFEEAERERKLTALATVFGFCAAAALDLGWVRVSEGVEAVALWIPPGAPEMSPADEERLPGVVAGACGPESEARVLEL